MTYRNAPEPLNGRVFELVRLCSYRAATDEFRFEHEYQRRSEAPAA
jgi:hypothetical protein